MKNLILSSKIILIAFILSFLINPTSPFKSIHSSEEFKVFDEQKLFVDWFVDSTVTSESFPIGLFATVEGIPFVINSTWGTSITGTVNSDYDVQIVWLDLPENSSTGTGIVSIYANDILYFTHSISWAKKNNPSQPPQKITLEHNLFYFWAGDTKLTVTFFDNRTVKIIHKVLREGVLMDFLPYNESFLFTTEILASDWASLSEYVLENSSINWQSWNYPPPNLTHPHPAIWDGGGFSTKVTITWNNTTQISYLHMKDDNNGTGKRIYTVPSAVYFNEWLLNKTDDLITGYFKKNITETSSTTVPTTKSTFSES
ncbi:MAG: hypothetical protein JSV04_09245, partial [Candidatus Heimdallarchaeota archaeon]